MATWRGTITIRSGMQPDSLKLTSQLAILKLLQGTAFHLERRLGDKAGGKTIFLKGIQGEVSRPVWNRDYFYLNAKIQQVRKYMCENCVHTVLADLFSLAMDIFSRYDNRRRMGVEVMLLCMLSSPSMARFEIPEKYHASYFVIDMLVSCRHRFQKPSAAFFWSKQSEAMLMSTFRQCSNLSKLVLPLSNDILLKSVSVYCRNLTELEIQLSLDATEEGLLAIAGRSAAEADQGLHRHWESALYLHKDFGSSKEWYIKDSLMFTPPATLKRTLPPKQCDNLLRTYPTDFGCLQLRKFRLSGEFIFPPIAARAKVNKFDAGPVVEVGIYSLLMHLKQLSQLTFSFTPLAVARLWSLLPPDRRSRLSLSLAELSLGWEEALDIDELDAVARLCPHVAELKGVSVGVLNDKYRGERHLQDAAVCGFLKRFTRLQKLSSHLKLTCLNSFLAVSGHNLTSLTCSSFVLFTADILVLRRYCVNLEKLEGRFSLDNTVDRAQPDYHTDHGPEFDGTLPPTTAANSHLGAAPPPLAVNIDSPWPDWQPVVARWPWPALRTLDLNGRINCRLMQILVAAADHLEILSITNWPNEMVAGGMAFDDTWIGGLLEANPLANLRELTIRMECDHYVEEGFLTRASLGQLLAHASQHSPKLEKVVGEWTKVPDRDISAMEEEYTRKGLNVKVRNAEPYREFQNSEDNDRFYGMNEGYWRNQVGNPPNPQPGQPQAQNEDATTKDEIQFRHKRVWGYIYRPYKSEPTETPS